MGDSWFDTWEMDRIERQLGALWVERIMGASNGLAWCVCRAAGAWDANESEDYVAYRSLYKIMAENCHN